MIKGFERLAKILLIGLLVLLTILITSHCILIQKRILAVSTNNNDVIDSLIYINNKIAQSSGNIIADKDRIIIEEDNFNTIIYYKDNWLMEQYNSKGSKLNKLTGEKIVELKSFEVDNSDDFYIIHIETLQGNNYDLRIKNEK